MPLAGKAREHAAAIVGNIEPSPGCGDLVVREEHRQPARNAGPARLKGAIDEGGTRDKVPGFDPGAAPLGTDEESGGAPLSGDAGRRASIMAGQEIGSRARVSSADYIQIHCGALCAD